VFGEEHDESEYRIIERIAVVWLTVAQPGAGVKVT
jgi:hypothetical protein